MRSWRTILGVGLPVFVLVYLFLSWTDDDGGPDADRSAASSELGVGVEDETAAGSAAVDDDVASGSPTADDDRSDGDGDGGEGASDQLNAPALAAQLSDEDYYTDFSAPLGEEWEIYSSIGHAGWGLRRPSAVDVIDDPDAAGGKLLTITATMGEGEEEGLLVSGGLKLKRPQIYGRYTMRVKVDKDPAEVTSGVALLWPTSNRWPEDGEIDIFETWASRATRSPVESNLHWLDPEATRPFERSDDRKSLHLHEGVDASEWHVYQLVWREDVVSVSIDGGEPAVLSTDPAEIADWNMEPTLQLDAFSSPDTPELQPVLEDEVVMYVDYLIVER